MNINIIIAIENDILKSGLNTIISEGILSSNVIEIKKSDLLSKINLVFFDAVIIDIKPNNKIDFDLITKIISIDKNIKIFVLSPKNIESRMLKLINSGCIGVILNSYSNKTIIKLIKFKLQINSILEKSVRVKKKHNSQNIEKLLSSRELEVGLMLVKGETISSISEKKNLALTTISTYKKRIFQKTKVKNLIEMAKLFEKIKILNQTT
ncbi:response regulator transcription factor [Flavobacterium sp.]|uniref:helix-turn-helix transcriptional regulator n=1 Tax=Flavobacterium sp. TaxID=239 RepID=UPI003753DCC4